MSHANDEGYNRHDDTEYPVTMQRQSLPIRVQCLQCAQAIRDEAVEQTLSSCTIIVTREGDVRHAADSFRGARCR